MQVGEDRLGTSSGCHWVFPWQQLWTAQTTRVLRISTSYPSKGSKVGSIACLQLALVTWSWPLSRKASLICVRRFFLLSLFASANLGAERTVFLCTSKVLMKSCLVFVVIFFFFDRFPIGQIGFWCRRGSNRVSYLTIREFISWTNWNPWLVFMFVASRVAKMSGQINCWSFVVC